MLQFGGVEYLSGRSPEAFWKRIHQICVFQFNISNFMQMWSCPFLILKAESPFWKKLLDKVWNETKMDTPPQLRVLDDHSFEVKFKLLLALKLLVFHRRATKRKLNPLAIWRCDIYIYRICIYIYLHTYKYYLHTYTYYIYIFDIGGSESKTSRFGFLIQKGWACLLYCVRGGCWVLWYQWCELCKAVEGHAPCSQPCPNLYM